MKAFQSDPLLKGAEVTAKCIGCGAIREIKAGEVPKGEQPMCSDCGMPMVAVKAEGCSS